MLFSGALLVIVLLVVVATVAAAATGRGRNGTSPLHVTTATPPVGAASEAPTGARSGGPNRPFGRPHQRRAVDPRLGILLDHWVAAGLLAPDQADAIADHERQRMEALGATNAPAPPSPRPTPTPTTDTALRSPRRIPVVAEALGYIGGILGVVGLVLLVGRYWDDLATAARLALAGTAAAALVVAGRLVHEHADPALARLRWTLWTASTVAIGVFAVVAADQALGIDTDERVAMVVAASVALHSGVLWWNRPRPVQQVTMFGGLVLAVTLTAQEFIGGMMSGAAVWTVGALVMVLGVRRLTSLPAITLAAGAVATVVGTVLVATVREGVGFPLVCLDAAALIALAIAPRALSIAGDRVIVGVIGGVTLFQTTPQAIVWFAGDAGVVTGIVVAAVGASLLLVAARRQVRGAIAIEVIGGIAVIGGAAVTGVQSAGFATVFGITVAVAFVVLGMLPGRVLMSLFGSAGLLVFVPWTIAHYFPGEDRAPLLILVSGALLVAIAVLLTRQGARFRRELTSREMTGRDAGHTVNGPTGRPGSDARGVDVDAEEHPAQRLVESG